MGAKLEKKLARKRNNETEIETGSRGLANRISDAKLEKTITRTSIY